MKIKSIPLFPKQFEICQTILNSNKRFVCLNASRQFSKSTIIQNILMSRSINIGGTKSLYLTPTYSLSRVVMNQLYQDLFPTGTIKTYNKSENYLQFTNKSEVFFRSATNPITTRGLSVHYCYLDEAGFMADDIWNVARPTLNVLGKQMVLVSTPRGKSGFFYTSCQQSQENPNYEYLFGNYRENPYYNKLEIEDAKLTLPENIFLQEYEGQFLEDGGSVFQNVHYCSTIDTFKNDFKGGRGSIGIDLGRQSDWTVVTVLNELNEVIEIYRDNKKNWTVLVDNINKIIKKYKGFTVLCETNGIGDVVYDLLHKENSDVRPFTTTNDSKNEIIEELILEFQKGSIKIPTQKIFPQLHSELNTFTFTYSQKTRRIMYGSMIGFHDDCVMSLALAVKANKVGKNFRFKIIS